MEEKDLQYGEKVILDAGTCIYKTGSALEQKPVYYIIAGLVKIEFNLEEGRKFPLYLQPDAVFGLVEPLLASERVTAAYCMEKSILYHWDLESFDMASGVHWELALNTITGLTQILRILNAEFGERLGLVEDRI
jgi:CRP-like cAMP-binding protein